MLDIPAHDVVNVDALTAGTRALSTSIRNVKETHLHMRDERRPLFPRRLHLADKTLGKTVERRRHFVQVSMDRNVFL
jgi:hypothetical protein